MPALRAVVRNQLVGLAVDVTRKCGLSQDEAEDLAHDTLVELQRDGYRLDCSWRQLRATLVRFAKCRQKRTERELARLSEGPRQPRRRGRSVPVLCPRLAELAPHHCKPKRFLTTLRRASQRVAHRRGLLADRQLRLFLWAYEDRFSLPEIRARVENPPRADRALAERIRRVSLRVQRCLLTEVERSLAKRIAGPKPVPRQKKSQVSVTAYSTKLSVDVEAALRVRFGF